MDANTLITFGVPALVLGSWIYRRIRPARPAEPEQPSMQDIMQASDEDGEPAPLPLATVLALLNTKRDDIPHCFVVGGTGAGKSTFGRLLLAPRIARGDQFVIITGKRTAVFDDLPCIGRGPTGADGQLNFEDVRQAFLALSRELARRDNTPLRSRTFSTLNIVIDDATILLDRLTEAADFLRDAALLGRELDMRLIVLLGSLRVKELGWEGRGDLREHFAVVTLQKNLDESRTTLIRPRFDDKRDLLFDGSQVAHVSRQARINPAKAWRAARDPELELLDLIGGQAQEPAFACADSGGISPADGAHANTNGQTNGQTNGSEERITLYMTWKAAKIQKEQARAIRRSMGAGLDDAEWAEAGKRAGL